MLRYSVGEALSWAWNRFTKNAAPLIVATLVGGLITTSAVLLYMWVTGNVVMAITHIHDTRELSTRTRFWVGAAVTFLHSIVLSLVAGVIASAYYRGLLEIADGRPVTIASFLRPRNVVSVVIASLIFGILFFIGVTLCVLPAVIVTFFAFFTTVAIVDRNLSPIDGIRANIDVVKNNFGASLLAALTAVGLLLAGVLAFGVGALAAAPVVYLFGVYTYRTLSGGTVATATGTTTDPGSGTA